MHAVKQVIAIFMLTMTWAWAAAQTAPLPRNRPATAAETPDGNPPASDETAPSACRLRLTSRLAVAPSLPPILGPGECGGEDLVELEAVVLADKSRVAVTPPAIVNCAFAEAIVAWVRQDILPATRSLGSALKSIDNYASYDCRGRNRVIGAKLSEHGKANALDVRSLALANGKVVRLTDLRLDKDFREGLRRRTCLRLQRCLDLGRTATTRIIFTSISPSAGRGHRMCQWEIREEEEASPVSSAVPLPRPRPARS
jgi:hypothetical protein